MLAMRIDQHRQTSHPLGKYLRLYITVYAANTNYGTRLSTFLGT